MITNIQLIALYTIVRREVVRMMRIFAQVFLPPVITMTLYFLIFGQLMGKRIGSIHGLPYAKFIAPGLIMMSVITNAYSNVSSSLYSNRFQRNIEEILVSPTANGIFLWGYVLGGVIRAFIVAILVTFITRCFIPLPIQHPWLTLLVIFLVSVSFAMAGFTNALYAKNFDDIMLVPTFVLTPLTYLGGVFYSVTLLPSFWQSLSHLNPILYIVNAFRFTMLGVSDIPAVPSIGIIAFFALFMTVLNLVLLRRGFGLKE